jgi:hypothetical protein
MSCISVVFQRDRKLYSNLSIKRESEPAGSHTFGKRAVCYPSTQ